MLQFFHKICCYCSVWAGLKWTSLHCNRLSKKSKQRLFTLYHYCNVIHMSQYYHFCIKIEFFTEKLFNKWWCDFCMGLYPGHLCSPTVLHYRHIFHFYQITEASSDLNIALSRIAISIKLQLHVRPYIQWSKGQAMCISSINLSDKW